jgi:DNA anti-recombination protein RmuC
MIMAVMVRETWTDERLDDLSKKVDDGFARVDADIRELRAEIGGMRKENKHEFAKVRTEMNQEFASLRAEMNARFEAMNRNFLAGLVTIIAAIIGSNAF